MRITFFKTALRGNSIMIPAALLTAASLASPAMAQSAPAASDAESADTIVVTGSRIARPDLKSTVPISIITGDNFIKQGNTNIGDTLNDYPQLRSSRGQQNSSTGVGISGLNLLDLRGLGTVRTLVLVNGRRHVGADILNNAVSVDTNTIPANLIQRVDIVTGGESAIYGSDAIAGVVNFILKKDFDGLEASAKFGISTPGSFGANYHIDALYGKNFADGRGNITFSAEYNHQDRVYASDVPYLRRVDGFVINDLDPGGLTNGSDGVFDRILVSDIRQANVNVNGLVPITQGTVGAGCGIGVGNGVTAGTPYNCTYLFNNDGTLVPQTGTRYGTGVIGSITGGNGNTGREGDLYTLLPKQDIYNFNLIGHYEFSEAADLFWEAKYTRIVSLGGNAGAASIQGTFAQFDLRERIRLDNPFLNSAARTLISNGLLTSGCNPSLTTACNVTGVASTTTRTTFGGQGIGGPLSAADIAQIAAGTYRFTIARSLDDLGERREKFLRQTYRAVIGMRGTFNSDWKYEITFNYGRFSEHTDANGYVDKQRFLLSLDAGLNPATGKIECRAKFDPFSATAFPASGSNQLKLAGDIAACVPFNPFGKPDNSAAVNYFSVTYNNDSWMTQRDVSGYMAGDTSGFFNLPGGPVSFAVGGEYREEDAQYDQDSFAAAGNTTAVAFGSFAPDPFRVTEAFAELHVPILKDRPFFEDLSFSGAGRVSHYNGGAGTVWAFNGGGEWSPTPGLVFRANYSKAVRAPNLTETFGPLIPNFSPGFTDPCSAGRIGSGTQFRSANCSTDLGNLLGNLASLGSYSLPILSGVNPNLQAETSNSLTIGAVVQPRGVPGLTLTVDYYNIKVNKVIVALTAQNIANACYDQPTLANPFCGLFRRVRSGTGPFGEVPGQIEGNTLLSAPFNFAKRVRRGIDTNLDYNIGLGNDFKLSTNLKYSHVFQNSNYENPTLPDFENRILSELGDPQDEFLWSVDLKKGPFTFGYEMHFIGPMYVGAYEDFNALQDRPPQDADASEIARFPSVFYHNIRFEWDMDKSGIAKNFLFYAGVDNLFNKTPPFGSTGAGGSGGGGANDRPGSQNSNAAIYSVRGRQLYAGIRAKF
ncbi:MAG: TonB-dependent receptor [Novosphingobium sp.]